MDGRRALAYALLAGAALLLGAAALRGELQAGFFLFIPFVSGTGLLPLLAMLLLMTGLALLAFSAMPRPNPEPEARDAHPPDAVEEEERARRIRSGGVVLLGPIPIVWGSDRRILPWMVGLGLLLLVLALAVTLL